MLKNGVVYKVPCHDCEEVYVGETMRTLSTRVQEHKRHTRKAELQRSAIAEHACSRGHRICWEGADIVDRESDWRSRKMKEALYIYTEKRKGAVMNKDDGWRIHETWQAVL